MKKKVTVAARPSPKAAIAFVAYMRENARRHCQETHITSMLTRKISYNMNAYPKYFIPDCGVWLRIEFE
jgi:hypothetical protein